MTRPWAWKLAAARALANVYGADLLAMAWCIAMEREGFYMNKGHLKP